MKKIITAVMAVAITCSAIAQKQNSEQKAERRGQKTEMMKHKGKHHPGMAQGKMAEKLNFTDAQKAQLKTLNENFRKQMTELHNNENITVKEQRDRRSALAKQHKQAVQNLMTPEQKKQAEEMKKDFAKKGGEMRQKGMARMQEKLNLSDDQASKLKASNEALHAKMKALKENENISREDKKAQIQALREEHKKSLQSILTPEQQEKMKEMRKNRPNRQEAK